MCFYADIDLHVSQQFYVYDPRPRVTGTSYADRKNVITERKGQTV